MEKSHIQTVEDLLHSRETRGLRVPVTARILFGSYGLVTALTSPLPAESRILISCISIPFLIINIYLLTLLRREIKIRLVGITGIVIDSISVLMYPFILYNIYQSLQPIAMVSKLPQLMAVSLIFIIIESLALRPLYPLVITGAALLSHLGMIVSSLHHPAATWSSALVNDFSGDAVSLMGIVHAMIFIAIAGGALAWLARGARKTIIQAAELEADRIEIIREQANLLTESRIGVLEEFVVSVSHEMNSPLGAVKSNAETGRRAASRMRENLCQSDEFEAKEEKIGQILGALEKSSLSTLEATERMEEILKTLRSFAHIDEAEFKEVDVHEALESTLALIPPKTIGQTQIERKYAELPKIYAYAGRLNQVFMILLSNAFERSGDEGTVTLSTEHRANEVAIRIADSGPGIPEKELEQIFEIRLRPGQSRVEAGFGMAACQSIVSQHKGQLLADSIVGQGTGFTIILPAG